MTDKITPAMLRALSEGRGILAGTPGAIEASEKAGQTELVRSTNMPLELGGRRYGESGKEMFEAVGFTFGKQIDDVFQEAQLPDGWKRETSDHSMWSYIVDERGRQRVAVFYKAAFYDRRANAGLNARYSVGNHYDGGKCLGAAIIDCGNVIKLVPYPADADYNAEQAILDTLRKEFEQDRPNWLDPLAYWDEP